MKTEIYYFSGTGNSLYIARELKKRLPGVSLIPIVKLLKKDRITAAAESVGFIFPVYLTTLPAPVRLFLEKLDISRTKYIFSVATRIGTFAVANRNIERILKLKGKSLDAQFFINMAGNSPTGLKPGKGDKKWADKISKKNITLIESTLKSRLSEISGMIKAKKKFPEKTLNNPLFSILERVMYYLTYKTNVNIGYYTDNSCTGCGKCSEVCLSGKVKIIKKKPVWQRGVNCFYCYACFNVCPFQSILIKDKYTYKNGRYIHPGITADDIAAQK